MTENSQVQLLHCLPTTRSVLALVCLDLGGMWELAFVRMKPADFEALTTGTHLDELELRYLERTAVDDQEVGLELVAEWQASPVWQRALRAAESRTLSASIQMPRKAPAATRARL